MLCLKCGSHKSRVIDSRPGGSVDIPYGHIRRRRKCLHCGHRQTTYETVTLIETIDLPGLVAAKETLDVIRVLLKVKTQ